MHTQPRLTPAELELFNELFSKVFGLYFPQHKREILENRLTPRLRANKLRRFFDYYLLLQYNLASEIDPLTRSITNNESYFFRETPQFEALCSRVLLDLLSAAGGRPLRVLSAGCSAGEEPFSLGVFLRDFGYISNVEIDAIDLDSERLATAELGMYRPSAVRALDATTIERLFHRRSEETYELKSLHRQNIRFSRGNILELDSVQNRQAYDVVFCRNVLIYFSEEALKHAIDNFVAIIRPGGLLFLGHSESIIGLTSAFRVERLNRTSAYRRQGDK